MVEQLPIINDILDLSKIESGMFELEEQVFILSDIAKSVCSLLGKVTSDKEIMLSCTIDPNTPTTFIGDSSRLRQVFLNILGNAVKFTKKGSVSLAISSRFTPNNGNNMHELLVSVTDSGIGIRSDRISKLFQPFTQADAAITRKYGGTGLGLAISKCIIELMGGTIWVESLGNIGGVPPADWDLGSNYTQGSTFHFRIQLEAEYALIPKNSDSSLQPVYINQETSTLNILVAEDNLVNQKVIMRILGKFGYSLDIVNNGVEVLEALTKQKYDLLLMDMQMPIMDGIEATMRICDLYPLQMRPYIIAMTANAMDSDRDACLKAGMNDYLSKPIRMEDLATVLKKVELAKIA